MPELKILTALRFYATGSYQRCIGQDFCLGLSQTMISRIVEEVTDVANTYFVYKMVKFPRTQDEKLKIKQKFMEKTNFPGIIGAVDGTHVHILTPRDEEWNYYNRKGFHSINAQVTCDYELNILGINARYPGATHDSAIWSTSAIRTEMQNNYTNGDNTTWLIGKCILINLSKRVNVLYIIL